MTAQAPGRHNVVDDDHATSAGDGQPARAGVHRRLGRLVTSPAFVLGLAIVVSSALTLRQVRRLYFIGDDWAFLLGRDLSWDSLMRPHNEHWSTLPVIAFRSMVSIFGIDHYPAYALMPLLLHAAFCVLLYVLLRRHDIGAWPAALVVIPFSFLCGGIAENPTWDFQIGFLGSGVFGLLSVVLASREGRRALVLSWLSTVAGFLCSGIAIPMLVWLGLYVLLTRGLRRALIFTVPPALIYAAWWLGFGRYATTALPDGTPNDYVGFVATGLGSLWQEVLRVPSSGALALFALLAVSWLVPLDRRQRSLALSGLVAALALYLLIGVNRAGLGAEAGATSRYAYFALAFTLPAAAITCERVARRLAARPTERALAAAVVVVLLAGNGYAQMQVQVEKRHKLIGPLAGQVRATRDLIASGARFLNQVPSPIYNPDITVARLDQARRAGELPTKPASPQRLLDTAAVLQVSSNAAAFALPTASDVRTFGLSERKATNGCDRYRAGNTAYVDIARSDAGSQISVASSRATLPAQLVDGSRTSDKVDLTMTPGRRTFVATTSSRADLRLYLPPGLVTVCTAG